MTLYVVGFTEAVFSAFPSIGLSFHTIGSITNFIVFICVYIGAGWTIRLQYGILAILLLSVLSFYIDGILGFSPEILRANLNPQWTKEFSFCTIFTPLFSGSPRQPIRRSNIGRGRDALL